MDFIDGLAAALAADESLRHHLATTVPEIGATVLDEHIARSTGAHIDRFVQCHRRDDMLLIGLILSSGAEVALAIHDKAEAPHLHAAYALQKQLAEHSRIAPAVYGFPHVVANALIATMAWRKEGAYCRTGDARHLRQVATTLHGFTTCFAGLTMPMGLGRQAITASKDDAVSQKAHAVLAESPPGRHVVGHCAMNQDRVRHDAGGMVVAVFDWHCLGFDEEEAMVAKVGARYADMDAFIAAYERARGEPFVEARRLMAHAVLFLDAGSKQRALLAARL